MQNWGDQQQITVSYHLTPGSATAADYQDQTGGSVTLKNPGNNYYGPSGEAIVLFQKDNLVEGNETFQIQFDSSGSGYNMTGTTTFNCTIQDDPPIVTISASDATAAEPATADGQADHGHISVDRTGGDTSTPIDVGISLGGTASSGEDYTSSTTSTVSVGTHADIDITPKFDTNNYETDESVVATTQPSSNNTYKLAPPPATTATVVITGRNGFFDLGNVVTSRSFE